MDFRSRGIEDSIVCIIFNRLRNDFCVNGIERSLVSAVGNCIINEKGLDEVANFGAQSLLHLTRTGREIDDVVRWMAGLETLYQELAQKQAQVILHWQDPRFPVEMIYRRERVAAGD